jgi:hypothetical protein
VHTRETWAKLRVGRCSTWEFWPVEWANIQGHAMHIHTVIRPPYLPKVAPWLGSHKPQYFINDHKTMDQTNGVEITCSQWIHFIVHACECVACKPPSTERRPLKMHDSNAIVVLYYFCGEFRPCPDKSCCLHAWNIRISQARGEFESEILSR